MITDTPDSLANWYDNGGQNLYISKAVSAYRTPVDTLANLNLASAEWELVARFLPVSWTEEAEGSVRYVWTVNGQELDTTAGEISVPWVHGIPSTAVTITPVYSLLGTETLGTSIPVTITNRPLGLTFYIR